MHAIKLASQTVCKPYNAHRASSGVVTRTNSVISTVPRVTQWAL